MFRLDLSPVLRARMCECMYGESIRKIRCFFDAPKSFVGELGAALEPEAYAAMEPLIRRNEISGEVDSKGNSVTLIIPHRLLNLENNISQLIFRSFP